MRPKMEARRGREDMAGEHAFTDTGQLVLVALFLAVWTTDSFVFRYSVFAAAFVPWWLRVLIGLAALVASPLLAIPAHRAVFGEAVPRPRVIAKGVYSVVRHPMYLGSWLFFVGLAVATLSLASLAVSALMLGFYYVVSAYEERLLVDKFGEEYRAYQARVPMFLPLRPGRTRRSA